MNPCQRLLRLIQAVEFCALELTLYLDTHPADRKALSDYNRFAGELERLKKRYVAECGPLMTCEPEPSASCWRWSKALWPWELDYGGCRK